VVSIKSNKALEEREIYPIFVLVYSQGKKLGLD
jgi:hypothetical protein